MARKWLQMIVFFLISHFWTWNVNRNKNEFDMDSICFAYQFYQWIDYMWRWVNKIKKHNEYVNERQRNRKQIICLCNMELPLTALIDCIKNVRGRYIYIYMNCCRELFIYNSQCGWNREFLPIRRSNLYRWYGSTWFNYILFLIYIYFCMLVQCIFNFSIFSIFLSPEKSRKWKD